MGSQLFKQFIKKAILERQPGPPPREGLKWKPQTHRWIRPKEQVASEYDSPASKEPWEMTIDEELGWNMHRDATTVEESVHFGIDAVVDGKFDDAIKEGARRAMESKTKDFDWRPMWHKIWKPKHVEASDWTSSLDVLNTMAKNKDVRATIQRIAPHVKTLVSPEDSPSMFRMQPGWKNQSTLESPDEAVDYPDDMGEIAFENIKTDVEMAGLPGPKHFKNAKEYATFISESTFQSALDIRNDDEGEEEDYFLNTVGFTDTAENIDAYADALDAQAKEYAGNFTKEYGTGVHIDEMEDEEGYSDWDEDEDEDEYVTMVRQ